MSHMKPAVTAFVIPEPYEYKEYTLRALFPKAIERPEIGKVLATYKTLAEAKAAMTAETYILNEEYGFIVTPSMYGMEPEAKALADAEALEDSDEEVAD
jgi:hypothetical protein